MCTVRTGRCRICVAHHVGVTTVATLQELSPKRLVSAGNRAPAAQVVAGRSSKELARQMLR
jgi:hypothetical protein